MEDIIMKWKVVQVFGENIGDWRKYKILPFQVVAHIFANMCKLNENNEQDSLLKHFDHDLSNDCDFFLIQY